jgi:hypothetical protein
MSSTPARRRPNTGCGSSGSATGRAGPRRACRLGSLRPHPPPAPAAPIRDRPGHARAPEPGRPRQLPQQRRPRHLDKAPGRPAPSGRTPNTAGSHQRSHGIAKRGDRRSHAILGSDFVKPIPSIGVEPRRPLVMKGSAVRVRAAASRKPRSAGFLFAVSLTQRDFGPSSRRQRRCGCSRPRQQSQRSLGRSRTIETAEAKPRLCPRVRASRCWCEAAGSSPSAARRRPGAGPARRGAALSAREPGGKIPSRRPEVDRGPRGGNRRAGRVAPLVCSGEPRYSRGLRSLGPATEG